MCWSACAGQAGVRLNASTQWESIAAGLSKAGQAVPAVAPCRGGLSRDELSLVLDAVECGPGRLYSAFWAGFGFIDRATARQAVPIGSEEYLVFEGIAEELLHVTWDGLWQSPNYLWPQDRAWCLATNPDLDSSFLAGSARLVNRIVGHARIEALPAAPDTRVDAGA